MDDDGLIYLEGPAGERLIEAYNEFLDLCAEVDASADVPSANTG